MKKPIAVLGFDTELGSEAMVGGTISAEVLYGIRKVWVNCTLYAIDGEGYYLNDISTPGFISLEDKKRVVEKVVEKLDKINDSIREGLEDFRLNWYSEMQEARGL